MHEPEQAIRPTTSKPERDDGWKGMAFIAVAMAAVFFGAGLVFFTSDASSPRQECNEALDAADDLIGLATDSLELVADAFQALSVLDLERVEDIAAELDAERARELRAVYDQASEECRD